jgi:hypothetical protein
MSVYVVPMGFDANRVWERLLGLGVHVLFTDRVAFEVAYSTDTKRRDRMGFFESPCTYVQEEFGSFVSTLMYDLPSTSVERAVQLRKMCPIAEFIAHIPTPIQKGRSKAVSTGATGVVMPWGVYQRGQD